MAVMNRLLQCGICNGRLAGDKSPFTSGQGYIYRTRACPQCGTVYFTKQGPEEVTGMEQVEETGGVRRGGSGIGMPVPSALAAGPDDSTRNVQ